jgi:hypothetical protein
MKQFSAVRGRVSVIHRSCTFVIPESLLTELHRIERILSTDLAFCAHSLWLSSFLCPPSHSLTFHLFLCPYWTKRSQGPGRSTADVFQWLIVATRELYSKANPTNERWHSCSWQTQPNPPPPLEYIREYNLLFVLLQYHAFKHTIPFPPKTLKPTSIARNFVGRVDIDCNFITNDGVLRV